MAIKNRQLKNVKAARPWMAPLSEKRMKDILRYNKYLEVYKNVDCVLVGDIVVLIEEVRKSRKAMRGPATKKLTPQQKIKRELKMRKNFGPGNI